MPILEEYLLGHKPKKKVFRHRLISKINLKEND
jgi:hypothetical protein